MQTIIFLMLIHSLWLGALLGPLTALILLLSKRAKPALRYRLLVGCMGLFTAAIGVSVAMSVSVLLRSGISVKGIGNALTEELGYYHTVGIGIGTWTGLQAYLHLYEDQLVWLWWGIMCIKSLQLAISMRRLHFIRHHATYDTGANWEQRLDSLCARQRIGRPVSMMQSGLTKVPLVIGYFKPLILMPLGLVNHLSEREVEAIICHELAHIKRHDYLVNLWQSLLGNVFFFNPAVLWLNRQIRIEREYCCDDAALEVNIGAHDYIQALLSCMQFKLHSSTNALSFAGQKHQLLHRVSRLIGIHKKKSAAARLAVIIPAIAAMLISISLCRPTGTATHTMITREESPRGLKEIKEVDHVALEHEGKNVQDQWPEFTDEDGNNMSHELKRDGITIDTNNTYYQIDDVQLIVNNKLQSPEIHRKYFDKYLKYSGRSICYSRTKESKSNH